jgi:hypothetical protein
MLSCHLKCKGKYILPSVGYLGFVIMTGKFSKNELVLVSTTKREKYLINIKLEIKSHSWSILFKM